MTVEINFFNGYYVMNDVIDPHLITNPYLRSSRCPFLNITILVQFIVVLLIELVSSSLQVC